MRSHATCSGGQRTCVTSPYLTRVAPGNTRPSSTTNTSTDLFSLTSAAVSAWSCDCHMTSAAVSAWSCDCHMTSAAWSCDCHMTTELPTACRGGATQHHVMSIFADSARTKMYGSLRERAGGSCRVQVTLF